MDRLKRLEGILKRAGSVLVAYSGGADSTFLLKVAHDVLGENVLAVTAVSPTYPKEELFFAKKMSEAIGVRHKIIKTNELKDKRFAVNPQNRCYFCKKELFNKLKDMAVRFKLRFVVDASNLSDKDDFRPGSKAGAELKIRSPLQEAGLKKKDIRRLSKGLGLETWDKPSLACLSSRIPYGTEISLGVLGRINRAEKFLRGAGFKQVRLRHYNGLCRIEVANADIPSLIPMRKLIVKRLKRIGYSYVTLDLEGYRTGSMNEIINPSTRFVRSGLY